MASQRSIVFEDTTILDFVQHVLAEHDGPSHLVFCGTRDDFLHALKAGAGHVDDEGNPQSGHPVVDEASESTSPPKALSARCLWSSPTLRSLAMSRTVKVVFCPDITHLRAYLATYVSHLPDGAATDMAQGDGDKKHILAILNLIRLHRPTSAFSAQGLNRTLSIAVEAAYHASCQLLIAECFGPQEAPERVPDADDVMENAMDTETAERPMPQSLWEEEVSILNVTTKSFGAGERGWVGRTVKLRTIAQRWCTFERLRLSGEAS